MHIIIGQLGAESRIILGSPQVGKLTANRLAAKLPFKCPLKGSLRQSQSPVLCSNNVHNLGGAMGIRTPDLLHAMNHSAAP